MKLSLPVAALLLFVAPALCDEPADRLARGVNISKWFWLAWGADPDRFITPADAAQLAELGFTHARIPVDPAWLWDQDIEALEPRPLEQLRSGIDRLTDAGLAVIIEIHPLRATWPQANTAEGAERLEILWRVLAPALAELDPGKVLLELMNEPHEFPATGDWAALQERLHAIVRSACPQHTIVLTGDRYGSIEGLLALEPLDDANVVYSFHIYDPHSFTHQGADWGPEHWKHMKNVPFPGVGERMDQTVAQADERARDATRWYASEEWTEEKLRNHLQKAIDWGRKHNVQVYCGEFGVHRPVSPLEDRNRWLTLVRETLEEHDIGWAVWEYVGTFGIMQGRPGARRPVEDVWDVLMPTATLDP